MIWTTVAPVTVPAAVHTETAPEPTVTELGQGPFGLNTHIATRYPDPSTMNIPADLVAEAGVGWAREDIHWWRVQPDQRTWDWTFTDQAVRELLARKVNIVGVLGHPPGWATPFAADQLREHSFYPPDQQQFAQYAARVVERYGKYIHYWEVWNEPDNPLFWKPAPDARAYTALLQATAQSIRRVDPKAQIIFGGINPFDTTFLRQSLQYGVWNSFDILGIHPYVDPVAPETGNIAAAADGVRTLMAPYGTKPIWATEVGWSSGRGDHDSTGVTSDQDQANYLVRASLLLWRAGIERIFWYSFKDDPGNPYGLIALGTGRADYRTRKPAFYALQTLNRELSGATFVHMNDLFTRTTLFDFETFGRWIRGDQPYGTLDATQAITRGGRGAQLTYSFPTNANDYVVFTRDRPIAIPDAPNALGVWVYGDGSGNGLKVWLRDDEGEVLQYALGTVGAAGWRFLQAPIDGPVEAWNRITKEGNGKLDFPASLVAIVLDDAPDTFTGEGSIYLDDITAISGPEAYDVRLQRGADNLDVLWSPVSVRVQLPTTATTGALTTWNGGEQQLNADTNADDNAFILDLGPAPIYINTPK